LAESLPATLADEPTQACLAVLDRALIDRVVSAREADSLVSLANDLRIDREAAIRINLSYLTALVRRLG
jgi:DNA polymerase-3 subunit epsilon